LAIPLGFLSARNVAPPALYYAVRSALNFFRSIDTLVYALLFVAAVGLGPFPGMLAVVAYTTTSLAKLYSETIEGIDPGPVDATPGPPVRDPAPGAPAVPLLRPLPFRVERPGRHGARLRRRGGDRALPADLSPDDRLSGGVHGAPGHRRDGDGGGLRERAAPG